MSKKSFIDSVEVKEPCSEDWNAMTGTDRIRFCSHCSKHVNNLSEMTRKEATRFVRSSNGDLCIRYITDPATQRPMFAAPLLQITRRTPALAAGVMSASLSLATLAFGQSEPETTPPNQPVVERPLDEQDEAERKDDDADKQPGIVRGMIRDYEGNPVAGVAIFINRSDDGGYAYDNAVTDKDGNYKFDDLEPGAYMIRIGASSGKLQKAGPALTLSSAQTVIQDINVRVVYRKAKADDETTIGSGRGSGYGFGGAIAVVEYSLPMSRAVANREVEKVRELLNAGAQVNGRDSNYEDITPLYIAVENGDMQMVRLLLQYGAKANVRDKQKRTPLMFIDEEATPALIRALLQAGAGVDVHDDSGNTPLFAAVESGKVELVQTLIEAGADVNASAEEGETALMRAVDRGYIEVVKALIITGSDINIRDKGEESAWDKTSDPEMEQVLVEAGAIVSYDVEVEKEPPTKNKKNNK